MTTTNNQILNPMELQRRSSEFSLSPSKTWSLVFDSDDTTRPRVPLNDPRATCVVNAPATTLAFREGSMDSSSYSYDMGSDRDKPFRNFDSGLPIRLPKPPSGGNSPELPPSSRSVQSRVSSESSRSAPMNAGSGINRSPIRYSGTNPFTLANKYEVHIPSGIKNSFAQVQLTPTELLKPDTQVRRLRNSNIPPIELLRSGSLSLSPQMQDEWTQTSIIAPSESSGGISPPSVHEIGVQTSNEYQRPHRLHKKSPTIFTVPSPPKLSEGKRSESTNSAVTSDVKRLNLCSTHSSSPLASLPPVPAYRENGPKSHIEGYVLCSDDPFKKGAMRGNQPPWLSRSRAFCFGEATGSVLYSALETVTSIALGVLTGVGKSLLSTNDPLESNKCSSSRCQHINSKSSNATQSSIPNEIFDGIICAEMPADIIGIPVQDVTSSKMAPPRKHPIQFGPSGSPNVHGRVGSSSNICKGVALSPTFQVDRTNAYVSISPPAQLIRTEANSLIK